MSGLPSYDVDFYADEVIRQPWPHYAAMRALGPVVWLPRHGNYALPRYKEVADCLRDSEAFCSGRGVAADKTGCDLMQGNSLASDGARHLALRSAVAPPLLPGALEDVRPLIESIAEDLIERLLARDEFDAMADLASHLPLTVVRDLVGLPDFGKDNMLRWAAAAFDLLGVQNPRGQAALGVFLEQRDFIAKHAKRENLKEGSWTRRIHELVDDGALTPELALFCIRDYINPSLDTTISATGHLIWQFSQNPDQWKLLQQRPELMTNAVNEAVRMGSPVRSFSRHATRDVEIAGHKIKEGSRLMVLYGSANRDERMFDEPDAFRITRNPKLHMGFGSGAHMCAGMHLGQLEMVALLKAMLPRVERIEAHDPVVAMNNTIHAYASLPARFEPRAAKGAAVATPTSSPAQGVRPAATALIKARVAHRRDIAENIICLDIVAEGDGPLPAWQPGAHVDVHIRSGLVRQYSLTGAAADGRYSIAVQKEPDSRGGSVEMFRKYKAGSAITIGAPRNHFPLHEQAAETLLLSGGIGLTPLLAMAWRLHELGKPFAWHVSARSRARLPFAAELDALPFRDRIVLHIDDESDGASLKAGEILRAAGADCHVYVCGPSGYMRFVHDAAAAAGIGGDRFHQEHFRAEIDVTGAPFTVMAARSKRSVEVGPTETILAALRRVGIEVETSCQNGLCGSCLTKVVDGRPDHRDIVLTDAEKASNEVIAVCCSRSQSRLLTLDV